MNQSKKLVHSNEIGLFIVLLAISIVCYIFLLFSIIGVLIIGVIWLLSFIAHGVMVGHIRSNGVKLTNSQYPEVHEKVKELCKDMSISLPDVYVVESAGILNAFATRLLGRNMVVLYSDIFELIEENAREEVNFIIAHELAHIKRNHIMKQIFLLPGNIIPFLGSAYSRACEYTCDRMAAHYINTGTAAPKGLMVLAIGKKLYNTVNKEAYIQQLQKEKSFFVWLSESISTHPPLPKRIAEVEHFLDIREREQFPVPIKKLAIIFVVGFILTIGATGVSLLAYQYIGTEMTEVFVDDINQSEEEYLLDLESTPLLDSIYNQDYELFQSLLLEEDITQTDIDGWNALHFASFFAEDDLMLKDLLKAGILPDEKESSGLTSLHVAIDSVYAPVEKVALLLNYGANPNEIDQDGLTPLMYSVYNDSDENIKMVELLLQAGADVQIVDNGGFSALDYAKDAGAEQLVKLLSE
ncbi:M48 family metallopeptidase [Cytobacillus sp. Hm23]